ncbi:Fibrillin-2, partial [Ooceraea biroi]
LVFSLSAILGNCPLQALPWGALREERVLENGTLQLRYFCEPGRRLKGHKVATCTANGWDHPVPKCVLDSELHHPYHFLLANQPIVSDKSNLQTTEKHFNVLANKKKNQKRLFVKAELNKTIVSQLDTTCLIEGSIQKFIKAPSIEHAHEARYAKRTNVRLPYNQFHVAIYSCMEGFVFLNLKNDRLFCSNGTWIGRHPKCVRKTEKVKHCAKHGKECQHVCEDTPTDIKCSCFDGFRAEGSSCIDIDECAEGTAKCTDICRNEPGTYHCECHHGFVLGNDRHSCQDVNECLSNNRHGPCQGICRNLKGSYECSCADIPGYKLAADNHTCEDIDECMLGNVNCSHQCYNVPGSAFCLCPSGYYLEDDWKTCLDINECQISNPCPNDTVCRNIVGSYKCVSKVRMEKVLRFEGTNVDEDRDDYEEIFTEEPNLLRKNPWSTHHVCRKGFKLKSVNGTSKCVDINECKLWKRRCQHKCVNEPGTYHCTCHSGYELKEDGRHCRDIDECTPGTHTCFHSCTNLVGSYECRASYRCDCPSGYVMQDDKKTCKDIDECLENNECYKCINTPGSYRCICPPGYILNEDGNTCKDVDECENIAMNDCSHDCINLKGSYSCSCPPGFKLGEDNRTCIVIIPYTCANSEGDDCTCPEGHTYLQEEHICKDIDECQDESRHNCSHFCINTSGSYYCECPSDLHMLADFKTCRQWDSFCVNEVGCSYSCKQDNDEVRCVCPTGYELIKYKKTCKDVNECDTGLHDCSHDCRNHDGGFTCHCPNYFILDKDNKTCLNMEHCIRLCVHKKSCLVNNGGCSDICTFVNDTSICDCSVGYRLSLQDNTTCWDINECSELRDICNQICINTPGSFKCSCRDGYAQMPYAPEICIDVNECEVIENGGCSHICVNTPGSYHCDCPVGYRLSPQDKITCKDINECVEQHVCDHTCINTPGSFKCSCWHGFVQSPNDPALCEDRDECEIENGGCSHTCMNVIGTYLCRCPEKYELTNDWKTCIWDGCKHNNGKCSHYCHPVLGPASVPGAIYCSCPRGYDLWHDGRTCKDIDECMEQHVCDHTCINNPGSYECRCRQGFRLVNGSTCVDIDECIEKAPCSKICINIPGSYYCTCPIGFKLQEDECVGNCNHECINIMGSFICSCCTGYTLILR